jgi:hypothetical protein
LQRTFPIREPVLLFMRYLDGCIIQRLGSTMGTSDPPFEPQDQTCLSSTAGVPSHIDIDISSVILPRLPQSNLTHNATVENRMKAMYLGVHGITRLTYAKLYLPLLIGSARVLRYVHVPLCNLNLKQISPMQPSFLFMCLLLELQQA